MSRRELPPLELSCPELPLVKFALARMAKVGSAMEKFTTWTLGAVAAICGVVLSHLEPLRNAAGAHNLHVSISFLVASLLAGAASKNIGVALAYGVTNYENALKVPPPNIPAGLDVDVLTERIANAFLWPLSRIVRSSFRDSLQPLGTELAFAKFFSWQWATNVLHVLLRGLGLLWLVFST